MANSSPKPVLEIKNLHVSIKDKPILHDLNLTLHEGEFHVLMGKNGQGKTTITQVLAGAPHYKITHGEILYRNESLLKYAPEERAALGLFIAFQQPIAIPGVSIIAFLKAATEALGKARGQAPLPTAKLLALVKEKMMHLGLHPDLIKRPLNQAFSGGEKKRLELLQMEVLDPSLAILDEPDSGLDANALKILGTMLQKMKDAKKTLLLITHYTHLFHYITPDYVHIIDQGHVIKKGNASLAETLFQKGYETLTYTR